MSGGAGAPSAADRHGTLRTVALGVAVAACVSLTAFLLLWPVLGGMLAVNDDLKFVRVPGPARGASEAVVAAWSSRAFRPLEVLAGLASDPWTLRCGASIASNAVGLLVLGRAVALLARMAIGDRSRAAGWAAALIAVAWVELSPATTAAAWQMDGGSQLWTAAAGTWATLFAWRAHRAAKAGAVPAAVLLGLAIAFLAGTVVKETMYGWSATLGAGCAALAVRDWRRGDRAAARRFAWVLVPVVGIPLAFLALRVASGAMGGVVASGPGDRYQAEFGINMVLNAAMLAAGSIGTGPFHAVMDDEASVLVRLLPAVAALVGGCLVALAAILAWVHRRGGGPARLWPAAWIALAAVGSALVTVPAGSASELYCLGANVGIGVLLAACTLSLWDPLADDERLLGRSAVTAGLAILFAIGAFGLVGRAVQFGVTWDTARVLNEQFVSHYRALPPRTGSVPTVYFRDACIRGRIYGSYVLPPVLTIDPEVTSAWITSLDPSRPIGCSFEAPPGDLQPQDLLIDCGAFPARPHW